VSFQAPTLVLEQLLPYKPRPASCIAPARRLLQWALGEIPSSHALY
jgi:hypothetical protein